MKHRSSRPALLSAEGFVLVLSCFLIFGGRFLSSSKEISCIESNLGPGVTYFRKFVPDVPWTVHVARVDRRRHGIGLETIMPLGKRIGLSKTTEQLRFLPPDAGQPVAAVNGDFFFWQRTPFQGDPLGVHIQRGELVSGPASTRIEPGETMANVCFWLDAKGRPHIEKIASDFQIILPDGHGTPFGLNCDPGEDGVSLFTPAIGCSTRTSNAVEWLLEPIKRGQGIPLRAGELSAMRIKAAGGPDSPLDENSLVLSFGAKRVSQKAGKWVFHGPARPPAADRVKKFKPAHPPAPFTAELSPGSVLVVSTRTTPDLKSASLAVGGGPTLVRNGAVVPDGKDTVRHPRAAFGFNKDYYFFVVADGRRAGVSVGMSFAELAREMKFWGCEQAINLDGGGSAMLWAGGQILSQPSENYERPCANALVAVRRNIKPAKTK